MVHLPYLLFATLLAFIPIWCGGQAMRCYHEGHVLRSAACVALAVTGTLGIFAFIWLLASNQLSFLVFFARLAYLLGV